MDSELRIFLSIGIVIYFILLFYLLKKETIILKYTIIWLLGGAFMVLFLLFPQVVFDASNLIGVANPVNAVFLLFAAFMIFMLLSITSIVSKNNGMVRGLTQQVALMEKRLRELENSSNKQ